MAKVMPTSNLTKDLILAAPPVAISVFGIALGDIASLISIAWILFLAGSKLYQYLKNRKKVKKEECE